jgi:hypothetical protein
LRLLDDCRRLRLLDERVATKRDAKWCVARSAQAKAAGDIFVQKTNAIDGGIVIELTPPDTQNIVPGSYYHEAEISNGPSTSSRSP